MKQCVFCGVASKYRCPKCLRDYCSVECYKCEEHLECSERFYRDCFMEALNEDAVVGSGGRGGGVAGMLKGVAGVDEMLPDEELERVFKSLQLGEESEQVWQMLEQQEKWSFISMHSRQDFTSIITTWQPWWKITLPKIIPHDQQFNHQAIKSMPQIFDPAPLKHLMPQHTPSTNIPFDIVNVLYAYCYVSRLHNGDLHDLLLDSAHAVVSISSCFSNHTYSSLLASIDHCLHNLTQSHTASNYFVSERFSVAVVADVVCVLQGGGCSDGNLFTKACLSALRRLFKKACKEKQQEEDELIGRKNLVKAFKKIEFYLSWLGSYGEKMEGMAGLLEVLLHVKMTEIERRKAQEEVVEKHMHELKPKKEKKLIQEM